MTAPDPRVLDQADRLYGLYERKARSFRTALIGVMGLVIVVFTLIFYPYVTFRAEKYDLDTRASNLERDVGNAADDARESAELLEEYLESMHASRREIAALRTEARGRAIERPQFRPGRQRADCPEGADPSAHRCRFSWLLDDAFYEASRPYATGHRSALRNRAFGPLERALRTLKQSFDAYLQGETRGWAFDGPAVIEPLGDNRRIQNRRHWQEQTTFTGDLSRLYDLFVDYYVDLLDAHQSGVNAVRAEARERHRELTRELQVVDARRAAIDAKLKDIQGFQNIDTPFGALPVGLDELVLLFPTLVAAGIALCASLLVDAINLRREHHALVRLSDPDATVVPDRRIALLAPLWIDPLQPWRARVVPIVILALPLVVFAGGLYLLWAHDLLAGPFVKQARLSVYVYLALYGLGALAVLDAVRRVVLALWRYPAASS